jgi:hypothetical protein
MNLIPMVLEMHRAKKDYQIAARQYWDSKYDRYETHPSAEALAKSEAEYNRLNTLDDNARSSLETEIMKLWPDVFINMGAYANEKSVRFFWQFHNRRKYGTRSNAYTVKLSALTSNKPNESKVFMSILGQEIPMFPLLQLSQKQKLGTRPWTQRDWKEVVTLVNRLIEIRGKQSIPEEGKSNE